MIRKCCPACCGIGSYLGKKWVRDGSGVSIYTKVSVRKPCKLCEGSGRVAESENLYTHHCEVRPYYRSIHGNRPLELERTLGYFLCAALVGYAGFVLYQDQPGLYGWPKLAVALMAPVILLSVLHHFPAATRLLKWCTLLFFLAIMCGGVVLEIARRDPSLRLSIAPWK